jgi:hypothetical protein
MNGSKVAATLLGAGLALGGAAQAQEFSRDYDELRSVRSDTDSVTVRWSMPFSGRDAEEAAPRMSLRLSQAGGGEMRNLDVVTYSFAPNAEQRLSSPFQFTANANGDGQGIGGWISEHPILFGVGLAVVGWGIYEATQDDDDPAPQVMS